MSKQNREEKKERSFEDEYGQKAINLAELYPPRPVIGVDCACWEIYKPELSRYVRNTAGCLKHDPELRRSLNKHIYSTNTIIVIN